MVDMRVLGISGSLRSGSSNGAILRAVAAEAPGGMEFVVCDDIGLLPHFNPDLDHDPPPAAVTRFRQQLAAAAGFVVSTPEYAHGVPGALKNALDWLVSSGEIGHKPVVLINASPAGGEYAQNSLIETLTVMDALVLRDVSMRLPFGRNKLDANGDISDPDLARRFRVALTALAAAIAPA